MLYSEALKVKPLSSLLSSLSSAYSSMAEEDETTMEVEAVEAFYGDDCIVLSIFPPHLHLHIKPRTADVDSQQFVEVTIELRAVPQYPSDPPYVGIIGSKGLDEIRQMHFSARLHDKAHELTSCLMLVALCEDVHEKELEEKVLQCDIEINRRQRFEAISELQQQRGGLIEPPKNNVLFSRLSLQDTVLEDTKVMNGEAGHTNQSRRKEPESGSSSNQASHRAHETRKQHQKGHKPSSSTGSNTGNRRRPGMRKRGGNHSRWQAKPCSDKE